jgi:hypothetical protein
MRPRKDKLDLDVMLPISIEDQDPIWQEHIRAIEQAVTLSALLEAAWELACCLTIWLVEAVLAQRAQQARSWPPCPVCGKKLESKGMQPRQLKTVLGTIHWQRRVGRCPQRCKIGQIAPFDEELGIEAQQRIDQQVKRRACLLAVFVPFETAAMLLSQVGGVKVSATTIWQWVQHIGQHLLAQLDHDLQALSEGWLPDEDPQGADWADFPLVIGGDGVMVPFRPTGGSPRGKTVYREVKVGILARLVPRLNRAGVVVTRLEQRRLVAMVGPLAQFAPRLWLEAVRQGVLQAACVVWISDGAAGLWGLYGTRLAEHAQGVLDFYHAAQNLWRGATAWLGGRSCQARQWFQTMRHRLRHGQANAVLDELQTVLALPDLPSATRKTLLRLYGYLDKHRDHMNYDQLKDLGLPIGSGLVESACKWLIQQRFKGVGMRWGEESFTHLLLIRLAWVNGRFDACFSASPKL